MVQPFPCSAISLSPTHTLTESSLPRQSFAFGGSLGGSKPQAILSLSLRALGGRIPRSARYRTASAASLISLATFSVSCLLKTSS